MERSRKSWNKKPASTLTRSGSLRFSIITSSDAFSTTAIHTDRERDEAVEPPFALDHIIFNSRAYRRYIFRNPKASNSAEVENNTPPTSKTPLIDTNQQESITINFDDAVISSFTVGNDLNENIIPVKQFNIPNSQNESTEVLVTVSDVTQTTRKPTPNFSRRELGWRKSTLISHPSSVDPSQQAAQVQGQSETRLVTILSATDIETKSHSDMTLNTTASISQSPRQYYKIILLGAGAVGKSPLAMQVGVAEFPQPLAFDLTITIVGLSVVRTCACGRGV